MRIVKVAATQMQCSSDIQKNIKNAEKLVRKAAQNGANIILLQELFENLYFCQVERPEFMDYAKEIEASPSVNHFRSIAKELKVVLPISFYEKKNNARYNSVVVIDADGKLSEVYRKSHIPDGPGYEEKFYFNPGDTGFKVFETKFAKIGIGICWDQWFPETARCLALQGAELLFYPTAIGSEPKYPSIDSKNHWQICMRGHAASNMIPVIASNRIGTEIFDDSKITFYGSSFIAGAEGELLKESDKSTESVIITEFDLDELALKRSSWGIFRDRRPDLYKTILTLDGRIVVSG